MLHQFRSAFIGVGLFSALINLLMLSGSMFMLQVYDRVLPSKSVPTLIGLSFIFLGLYAFQAVLDLIRTRVLVRIGSAFDESLSERVFGAVLKLPLKGARRPTPFSRFAISIPSAPSSPAWGQQPCSTCLGCRSISRSASLSIFISASPQRSAPSSLLHSLLSPRSPHAVPLAMWRSSAPPAAYSPNRAELTARCCTLWA